MKKIISVEIENIDNPGCNNGNYPEMVVTAEDGRVYHGMTCRCGNGCSDTDRVPEIGADFDGWYYEQ